MYRELSSNRFEPGSQNLRRARTENQTNGQKPELRTGQNQTESLVQRFSVLWISSELNFGNPNIAATLLTHSIAILIALPHWYSIYSGQFCRLFSS